MNVHVRTVVGLLCCVVGCGFPQPKDIADDGGGSAGSDAAIDAAIEDAPADASPDAPSGPCDPLMQTGCGANSKCTWLIDAVMPQYIGHIGCAPDGTSAAGAACTYGAAGTTGYDDCAKGSVCSAFIQPGVAGVCKQICDQQGGTPMCDASHTCVSYSQLFSTGETTPVAGGVCDETCDPLAANDFDGSGPRTRTSNICGSANRGCYGTPSNGTPPATSFMCAADIHYNIAQPAGLRHRVQCEDSNQCSSNGNVFINSCNQGYLPLLYESPGSTVTICTALCRPANCSVGACGSNGINRAGVAGNACNNTDRMGTFVASTAGTSTNPQVGPFETGGDHCQYLWTLEMPDMNNVLLSPLSNTLGFCFDHSKYMYDSNSDGVADTTFPSCAQLASGYNFGTDPTKPYEYFGASTLGCEDTTKAGLFSGKQPLNLKARKVLSSLPRPLYHRVMR